MYIISIEYLSGWWSAGSCVTWRDVAGYWHVSGRGGGWRGGWWRLGLACLVEAAWRGLARRVEATWWGLGMCWVRVVVGGVLACHVGSARWVGGGGAGWRGFAFSRVLHAVLGQQGGLAVAGCWGRMEVARVHEWLATSKVLRAVLGWRVGGGSMLRAMSGWRVGAGMNGSSSCAQGDGNGLQC
ncbi:hypothetical protein EDB89DRAFT_1911924 [Lactarius sanguifluus]|nr:hypothetical protein EDB89DRAFT_1911924 [Lactarius sanguifluus]